MLSGPGSAKRTTCSSSGYPTPRGSSFRAPRTRFISRTRGEWPKHSQPFSATTPYGETTTPSFMTS
jgi:hypothetical protein